ncbi:MAG: hypothetical protein K6B45_11610 [Bacteroidaceae bacterium]|nr:hypothetical protein [Bacteroidaceae bacterium]
MHRRSLIICPLLLLAASLISCGDAGHPSFRRSDEKAVRASLIRAEALMESDPHAARAVLDSIAYPHPLPKGKGARPAGLPSFRRGKGEAILQEGTGEAAHYAWLRTQIDYKCDVPLTSDSLARIATAYYGTPRRPDYHAAMAWYTLGCVYSDMNDDVNGADAFLKAKSLFPDTLIRYYALAEQNLGLHYLSRHMKNEAINEFKCSKQNLSRLADSSTVAFLDLKLAQSFLYMEKDDEAKGYLMKTLNNPYALDNVFNGALFEMAKIETYDYKDYWKAHEYLNQHINYTYNKKTLAGAYCLKAEIFQNQGQLDSAWYYFNRTLSCQIDLASFAYSYLQMAALAPKVGRSDSIEFYIQQHDHYIDTLYAISNQQAIRQVMNDHRVELEQQRLEEQHRRLLFGGIAVFVVLCLSLLTLFLLHRNRNNRKTLALQQAIRQNNVALMNLTVPSEEEKESAAVSAKTLTDPETYVRLFRLGRQLLDPEVMEEIEKLSVVSGGEDADRIRKRFADALDQSFVELMMMLRLAVPSLNKRELHYIISRMLGLDDKDIRTIQKTEDSTFRTQKMRLRQKFPAEIIEKLLLPIEDVNN